MVQNVSSDGLTFTLSPSTGGKTFTVKVSGTGITEFVGSVTWDGEDTDYSADGVTWTGVTVTGFDAFDHIKGIAYGGKKFVAVGDRGRAAYSNNQE
jgi:hypothetical protein